MYPYRVSTASIQCKNNIIAFYGPAITDPALLNIDGTFRILTEMFSILRDMWELFFHSQSTRKLSQKIRFTLSGIVNAV